MLLVVHTLVGIIGIAAAVYAWRYVSRTALGAPSAAPWRAIRAVAVISGVCLVIATYVWVTALGYRISTPEGPGRIIGMPFFVAFFDAAGRDYIGAISYLGGLGNAIFWFLAPQFGVAVYAWFTKQRSGV